MAAARGRPAATSAMTHAEASLRPMLTENTMDYKMRDKGWSKGKTARSVAVMVRGRNLESQASHIDCQHGSVGHISFSLLSWWGTSITEANA